MDRETEHLIAEAQRHLEEASAYSRNTAEARERHWDAIGRAKWCLEGARRRGARSAA